MKYLFLPSVFFLMVILTGFKKVESAVMPSITIETSVSGEAPSAPSGTSIPTLPGDPIPASPWDPLPKPAGTPDSVTPVIAQK